MPMMQHASADLLALVAVCNLKHLPNILGDLAMSQGLNRGAQPKLNAGTIQQITNARRLLQRFNAGDYRADETERGMLTSLCDWLAQQASELTKNPNPAVKPAWSDQQFVTAVPLPKTAFGELVEHVLMGRIG